MLFTWHQAMKIRSKANKAKQRESAQRLDWRREAGQLCITCGLHRARKGDPRGECTHCILKTNRDGDDSESPGIGDS